MRRSIHRILDANLNRASEGLRVVEDYLRFVEENAALAERAKEIRHALASSVREHLPISELVAARDSVQDPGRHLSTPHENCRANVDAVMVANLKRVQQALRSLEEWLKIETPRLATRIEQLRYDTYDLESRICFGDARATRLSHATLYVLADQGNSAEDFRSRIRSLVDAKVSIIQLRLKGIDDRTALQRAEAAAELTRNSASLLIMNDRIDLAMVVEADGVHLGQEDLPLVKARQIMPRGTLIGISTHSLEQALEAVSMGADYLGVGPTFPSQTKRFTDFPGLEFVRQVASKVATPAFAIGGIEADRVAEVRQAGLGRVAVSRAIWHAPDIAVACQRFQTMLACHEQVPPTQDSNP